MKLGNASTFWRSVAMRVRSERVFESAVALSAVVCRRMAAPGPCPAVRLMMLVCAGILLDSSLCGSALAQTTRGELRPENLARTATATASSEFSENYLAKFAIDGKLPAVGGHADLDQAWCVRGDVAHDRGQLDLEWEQPVTVAEIVYFGRTAWYLSECWKDYEVYVDDGEVPVATGQFRMVHGPQQVRLPKCQARKITLKFLSSYGGPNPGALEVLVLGTNPTDRELQRLTKAASQAAGLGSGMADVDRVDLEALQPLVTRLLAAHGDRYTNGQHHLQQVSALRQVAREAAEQDDASTLTRLMQIEDDLAALQRDVLLFDVEKLLVIKRHEITASHVYTYHYEGFSPGGGLYIVFPHQPNREPVELVASPTGQILDCDLSHDGHVILFSWRQRQDEGYHLWTINVDGTGLKQLTDGSWHDYNACWLPDGDIAFLTTRAAQFAYCWDAPVGVLHRMKPNGSDVRKLSANYLNDFTPQVLEDGRIIYSRWEYVDRPAIPIQSLWTINPDGTGLSVYFGNRVLSPGTFMDARPIPGTGTIICTMTGHNGPARGAIGVIDRTLGVNAQQSITNVTPDVPVPAVDQGDGNTDGTKQYSCPIPLDDTRFLVSARGPVLVRTLDGQCQSTAVAAPDNGMQYFYAQPIRARRRGPVVTTALVQTTERMATLFLQDVYQGLEPYVQRGEVKTIRVVRDIHKSVRIDPQLRAFGFQFPVISCGATYAAKDVLGDIRVEPDGSALFQVPAGVNLSFMALDDQGRAVQRMRSFTHLMPGENQGCIGCHEHRSRVPATQLTVALHKVPQQLQPPEWGAGGFDYARIVQPVLDRYCIECHNPTDTPGGIDLTGGKTDFFNVSYDVLARENQGQRGSPLVNWIPTYNGQEWNILETEPKTWGSPQSKLAEIVLSGHRDDQGAPRIQMDSDGVRRILAWIDLNVPYYGTSETAHPDRVGCRQMYPERLDEVLADVATRRCASCHNGGQIPRRVWLRVTEPEWNSFLVAPLALEAGGSQKCGAPVFLTREDPDYQAILATFTPITQLLKKTPRMDMDGSLSSPTVCRSSQ